MTAISRERIEEIRDEELAKCPTLAYMRVAERVAAEVEEKVRAEISMLRSVADNDLKRAESAEARVEKLEDENYRLKAIIVGAGRHQPIYNGRPSCPFCLEFTDDEGGHQEYCIVSKIERAASAARKEEG